MSRPALIVNQLAKAYRIGSRRKGSETLSSTLARQLVRPWESLRELTRLNTVGAADDDPSIVWALRDVSFTVNHGEIVGILGRNGAGKSTLLKILSRITLPTRGHARIFGRVSSLLEVGTGFHQELSGRDNVYMNGTILGMRKREIDRKFDEIVAFSGVERFIDTPVKRYSSGMKVRLAFAVAAHLEPEILIVDEVLAVGDAEFQQKCVGKMHEVADSGRTILFVSHQLGSLRALCQRGIVLIGGTPRVDAPIHEAIGAYLEFIQQRAEVPLAQREDRGGSGAVRLHHVEMLDQRGHSTTTVPAGEAARFEFQLERPHANVELMLTLYDNSGAVVSYCDMRNRGTHDQIEAEHTGRITCDVQAMNLLPGQYRVNVALRVAGQMADHIEGALFFEVEPAHIDGRFFRTAPATRGHALLPHRWRTEPTGAAAPFADAESVGEQLTSHSIKPTS